MEQYTLSKRLNNAAAIVGIIGFSWTVFNHFFPATPSNLNSDYVGIWFSSYNYPITKGKVDVIGTTEYFKNGSYNFVGQITVTSRNENEAVKVVYDADGAGNWEGDSESLLIKLNDIKSYPVSLKYGNKEVEHHLLHKLVPELNEFIPEGVSQNYDVDFIKSNTIAMSTLDPIGNKLKFVMSRSQKRYQRTRP